MFFLYACVDSEKDGPVEITDSRPDSGGTTDSRPDDDTADSVDTADSLDTAPPPPESLGALTLTVDAAVVTVLHAGFADPGVAEVWVEYRFEGGDWQVAPTVSAGAAVVLGVPADTEVEARAAARFGEVVVYSDVAVATTGTLPAGLLVPEVSVWDPSLAYEASFLMISVDHGDYTYGPPYWIEIVDRDGRIVWYRETPDDLMTLYPTVSRDGTHVWWDESDIFGILASDPRVVRQTLDGRWSVSQTLADMGQAIAEGPDDSWFYERRGASPVGVVQAFSDGSAVTVWDCAAWGSARGLSTNDCKLNACNWDEGRDTVLASSFYTDTVFEVAVGTGEVVRQMGQSTVGEPYAFDPPGDVFDYQHYPHWLDNGNLLVSTHVPGNYGVQVAGEYAVDDATHTLRRVWSYTSTDRFATQLGEANRLPNGNTLQGYGQDGAVREVTTDGAVVWDAAWPKDPSGYRVVGHATLIPDLYALNAGPSGR